MSAYDLAGFKAVDPSQTTDPYEALMPLNKEIRG